MPTSLRELRGEVRIELGDQITESQALELLTLAVNAFNVASSSIIVSVDTVDQNLDRTLGPMEKRLIVLLAVRLWLNGQARKHSLLALKQSNVAGSTNLTGIEFALAKRVKEMQPEIDKLIATLNKDGVLDGMEAIELGESLSWVEPAPVMGTYPWPYWSGWH